MKQGQGRKSWVCIAVVVGAALLWSFFFCSVAGPPANCTSWIRCAKGKVVVSTRTCRFPTCSPEECCADDPDDRGHTTLSLPTAPPQDCTSAPLCWPLVPLRSPAEKKCAGPFCTTKECCVEAPDCSSLAARLVCPRGSVPLANLSHQPCGTSHCTPEECCVPAPKCSDAASTLVCTNGALPRLHS
eukprot:RCo028168